MTHSPCAGRLGGVTSRSMLGCVVFSVTSNNSNGRFASYLHTPAYLGQPRQTTPHRPPSGGNGPGPGRITLRQCSHPVAKCCSASAPLLALRLWSGPVYPRVPPY